MVRYGAAGTHLNLDELGLRAGQRTSSFYSVEVAPLIIGGTKHEVVVPKGVGVTVERIAGGYLLSLELTARVCGPCTRCLADVCEEVWAEEEEFIPVTARGWQGSESETTPFVEEGVVDIAGLTREAIVLATPDRLLCSPECKGLCCTCGVDLNHGDCLCGALEV